MTSPIRDDKAEWKLGTGTHTLTCTLTCDPTSISGTGMGAHRPRKECIVGQIHSDANEPPLYLAIKMPDSSSSGVLELFLDHAGAKKLLEGWRGPASPTGSRSRATRSTVWAVAGDGWRADTSPTEIPVSRFQSSNGCYFKAGAYNKTKISEPGAMQGTLARASSATSCSRWGDTGGVAVRAAAHPRSARHGTAVAGDPTPSGCRRGEHGARRCSPWCRSWCELKACGAVEGVCWCGWRPCCCW